MKPAELSVQIRVPLCSERDTIEEAFEHFFEVARNVNDADRTAMITATGVLLNTIANEINKLEV